VPFYIFVLSRKRIQEESHTQVSTIIWLKLFTIGFVGYHVSAHYNLLGLNYMTASIGRILLFVYPTFVLILRAILLKKRQLVYNGWLSASFISESYWLSLKTLLLINKKTLV